MATRLRNLRLNRVDLVDEPANQHARVLIVKRRGSVHYSHTPAFEGEPDWLRAEKELLPHLHRSRSASLSHHNRYQEKKAMTYVPDLRKAKTDGWKQLEKAAEALSERSGLNRKGLPNLSKAQAIERLLRQKEYQHLAAEEMHRGPHTEENDK